MAEEQEIQKSDSMEGVVLGLGALSETLNKMNAFLEKHYVMNADDDEIDEDTEDYDEDVDEDEDVDDEELAKAFLMKRGYSFKGPIKTASSTHFGVKNPVGRPKKTVINKADDGDDTDDEDEDDDKMEKMIAGVTKAVLKQLMELNADKEHKVSPDYKWPLSSRAAAEDEEQKVTPRVKTEEVQKPIVASQLLKHDDDDVSDDNDDKEYPVVEDEEKETPVMKSTPATLEKELMNLRKSMDEQIKAGVKKGISEEMKRKGWHVEKSTAQKNIKTFGVNDPEMLRKSDATTSAGDTGDVTEELMKYSYNDIWNLRVKQMAEQGATPTDVFLKSAGQ